MNEIITFFNNYLDKKNYFIITTNKENIFENTEVNPKRVCAPFVTMKKTDRNSGIYIINGCRQH